MIDRKATRLILSLILILMISVFVTPCLAQETIRVGWALRDGMTEVNDGVYSGYNYDFLMKIAAYTDWEYEFVVDDSQALQDKLKNGEIDLLGTLLFTEERAKNFDYAEISYGTMYSIIFAPKTSGYSPYAFESFDGIKIGVISSESRLKNDLEEFALSVDFNYELNEYADSAALSAALQSGEVEAVLVNTYNPQANFVNLAEFAPVPYYFAVAPGEDDVLHKLNRALYQTNIEDPYLERELYEKYFNVEFTDDKLTDQELQIIEASKETPIDIGIIPSAGHPSCYWDEDTEQYSGIFMDTLNAVSEKTGLQFNYVGLDLSQGAPIAQLKKGNIDIVAGIVRNEGFEADSDLALSDPILNDSIVVIGKNGHDFLHDPSHKTMALMTGFQVANEYAKSTFPEHQIKEYATFDECLNAVASGKADMTVFLRTSANYMLQSPYYDQLEILPSYYKETDTCSAALSHEHPELVSIINKGLAMLTDVEYNEILMDSSIMDSYQFSTGDILYRFRIPLIVVLILVITIITLMGLSNFNRQQNEKKLQKAYEKEKAALAVAEEASTAKGNFMSRISHEIRTPLNAVIGYNMIARNELSEAKSNEDHRKAEMKTMDCLVKSEIASKHLLTIINDVLDMSAIESGKIKIANERFDFRNMITSLTAIFYSQAHAKDVDFQVVFNTLTEEWFVGDQMRVNQILANLLSNAIKFTPGGGKVKLIISQPEAEVNSSHIHFEVSDTGIGMEKEYLQRLWEPFEQANASISSRFGGTGLGLSITKGLVDLMGGEIEVQSEEGKGTTFSVDLTFGQTSQEGSTHSYDFSNVNALIVDDDPVTSDYIGMLFARCGAHYATANNGEDAISIFTRSQEEHRPFTMCLVDWQMPGMDGLKTVRRIHELATGEMPIVVITAYDYSEIADQANSVGVDSFLSKPLFQSSLFDLLVNIYGQDIKKSISKPEKMTFKNGRVLLAEDNQMNMEIAKKILTTAGLSVENAWNGKEAVKMFEEAPVGTYQAILMDIQMPIMDGHEATRQIRKSSHPEAQTIPIIAMTADAFSENIAKAFEAGMNDHVSKPIDLAKLFGALKKYIN